MATSKVSNKPELKVVRRSLRGSQTSAESVLWMVLKNRQFEGRKFRRQHSFENYIVDIYCPEENIVIELNGQFHDDPIRYTYDEIRKKYLESLGLTILVIENKVIFENIEGVLEMIAKNFKKV